VGGTSTIALEDAALISRKQQESIAIAIRFSGLNGKFNVCFIRVLFLYLLGNNRNIKNMLVITGRLKSLKFQMLTIPKN
jgi:hypothetical protein